MADPAAPAACDDPSLLLTPEATPREEVCRILIILNKNVHCSSNRKRLKIHPSNAALLIIILAVNEAVKFS